MLQFLVTLRSFIADRKNDDKGATAVEYGLMVALIAVAITVAVALIGTNLSALFNSIAVKLGVVAV